MDNETWKFSSAIKERGTNQGINKGLINKLGLIFFHPAPYHGLRGVDMVTSGRVVMVSVLLVLVREILRVIRSPC